MVMGLNIKDDETVALVSEVARQLGTTKTGAVRELARHRLAELQAEHAETIEARAAETTAWLEEQVWPHTRHLKPMTPQEEDDLLGHDEIFAR